MKKSDLKSAFKTSGESLKTRSFKVGGYSVAVTVIVLALIVLVNVIVGALPSGITKLDTTSDKLYTVSEQTRVMMEALDNDIIIYWVVRDGYEDTYIGTLLERYKQMSSHISVVKKDPDVYPSFVAKYTSTPTDNSLIIENGDNFKYVSYYDIYEYDYTNYESTGNYDVSFAGEPVLTSAIDFVTSDSLPRLYTLEGHGELTLSQDFSSAVKKQNINCDSLSLLSKGSVPDDAGMIIIYSPEHDISAAEKQMLSEYLLVGGKLLYVSDPPANKDVSFDNIEALIENYGVKLVDGIVIEGNQQHYYWSYPYYLLPDLGSHDTTASLIEANRQYMLPLAQGILIDENLDVSLTVSPLFTTSDSAYSKIAGQNLETYEKEVGDIDGPFNLGVAISQPLADGNSTEIVWVTSGALMNDNVNEMTSGANMDMYLNIINWMCGRSESSLQIHAKELTYEYLNIESLTATMLTVLFVGIIPVSYLVFGIVRWARRKKI